MKIYWGKTEFYQQKSHRGEQYTPAWLCIPDDSSLPYWVRKDGSLLREWQADGKPPDLTHFTEVYQVGRTSALDPALVLPEGI